MDYLLLFDFNELSSVLLIFFLHALLFAYMLLRKGIVLAEDDSKWLAGFIFLGALYICPFLLGYAGWYSQRPYREFMFFFPFQQLFLIGPVFYFYVRKLLRKEQKLTRKDLLHFMPAILYGLYTLMVFIVDKLILDEFFFYADGKDKDLSVWYQMAGLISMLFYLYLSLRHYINYRKISLQAVSFADEVSFTWIKHFSVAFGIILFLRVVFLITNPEWWNFGSKFWYYLCFSILLMYISLAGYAKTLKTAISIKTGLIGDLHHEEDGEEPKKQSIEEPHLSVWKSKIEDFFEHETNFQNPYLTLNDLASSLKTNRSIISKVINQEFNMNFNDFVNEKRVASVIQMMEKGEHANLNLLGIGLDCGFNSKATFNRAFKKYTGLTPNQYIAKNNL